MNNQNGNGQNMNYQNGNGQHMNNQNMNYQNGNGQNMNNQNMNYQNMNYQNGNGQYMNNQNMNYQNGDGQNMNEQEGKMVNKISYCLFTFFLGGLGIHKFYAGKTMVGVLYLIFSWTGIPSIMALIDFIIALFKKADNNGNFIV